MKGQLKCGHRRRQDGKKGHVTEGQTIEAKYNRMKCPRQEKDRDRKRTEKERKEFPELDSKRFGNSKSFIGTCIQDNLIIKR
jgi:hypothetical protein